MSIIDAYFALGTYKDYWRFNEDADKQVVSLIADDIDLKHHTISPYHKSDIYHVAHHNIHFIIDNIKKTRDEIITNLKDSNQIEIVNKTCENLAYSKMRNMTIRCPYCDSYIRTKVVDRVIVEVEDSELEDGETPHSKSCFEFKKYYYTFKTKSNKLVVANDLRDCLRIPEPDLFGLSLNSIGGTVEHVKRYADNNILYMSAGNTCLSITETKDGYYFHENYRLNKKTNNFDTIQLADRGKTLGTVMCDVWSLMAADKKDVNIAQLKRTNQDYLIVDVEPNTEYVLEYDLTDGEPDGKCYKFFKKSL